MKWNEAMYWKTKDIYHLPPHHHCLLSFVLVPPARYSTWPPLPHRLQPPFSGHALRNQGSSLALLVNWTGKWLLGQWGLLHLPPLRLKPRKESGCQAWPPQLTSMAGIYMCNITSIYIYIILYLWKSAVSTTIKKILLSFITWSIYSWIH